MNKLNTKASRQLNKIIEDGHNNIYKSNNIEKAIDRLRKYEELEVMPETVAYLLKFFKERTSAEYITQEMKFMSAYLKATDEISQLRLTKNWIKINSSEDYPTNNQQVFIVVKNELGRHIYQALFENNEIRTRFRTTNADYLKEVTHWMPLPEFPEE